MHNRLNCKSGFDAKRNESVGKPNLCLDFSKNLLYKNKLDHSAGGKEKTIKKKMIDKTRIVIKSKIKKRPLYKLRDCESEKTKDISAMNPLQLGTDVSYINMKDMSTTKSDLELIEEEENFRVSQDHKPSRTDQKRESMRYRKSLVFEPSNETNGSNIYKAQLFYEEGPTPYK